MTTTYLPQPHNPPLPPLAFTTSNPPSPKSKPKTKPRTKAETKTKNKTPAPAPAQNINNPFHVLYTDEEDSQDTVHRRKQSSHQHNTWHDATRYRRISHKFEDETSHRRREAENGNSASGHSPDHHKVIVDSSSLKRSGSVISRRATLRNRGRITRRNTTCKRDHRSASSPPKAKSSAFPAASSSSSSSSSPSSWWLPWLWPKFTFPVMRKRSLRYTKLKPTTTTLANFKTRQQFDQFIKSSNYESIVASILPDQIKYWYFTQPLHPKPQLHYHIKTEPKKTTSEVRNQVESVKFMDVLYENYKSRVFEQSGAEGAIKGIPPRFQTLFPQDRKHLNTRELNQLNVRLLLEILLRRTVAAKVEYRLKSHRFSDDVPHGLAHSWSSASTGGSTDSSNSTFSSQSQSQSQTQSNHRHRHRDHHRPREHHPRHQRKSPRKSEASSSPYYNNDDLILQNPAIFQDMLVQSQSQSQSHSSNSTPTKRQQGQDLYPVNIIMPSIANGMVTKHVSSMPSLVNKPAVQKQAKKPIVTSADCTEFSISSMATAPNGPSGAHLSDTIPTSPLGKSEDATTTALLQLENLAAFSSGGTTTTTTTKKKKSASTLNTSILDTLHLDDLSIDYDDNDDDENAGKSDVLT
ncbi:uncharacterized protein LODBEIA_P17860 [Lodderomyces beijingensis]|uniref:Uncharacterized protein n=1 Tax=Lodderomyces beijingensis TaxID=1775926 RepID=A0ABP0ZMZ0_9ASCO